LSEGNFASSRGGLQTVMVADGPRDDNNASGARAPFFLPPSLSIAFDDIDAQHQALIDIINLAAHAPPQLAALLAQLNTTLAHHFAHEEDVMRAQGYPQLAEHKLHHAHILGRVTEITDGLSRSGEPLRSSMENVFTNLIDDILRADLPFKTFLQGKGLVKS
jgi:hemerythrin-like metal-binding protein